VRWWVSQRPRVVEARISGRLEERELSLEACLVISQEDIAMDISDNRKANMCKWASGIEIRNQAGITCLEWV